MNRNKSPGILCVLGTSSNTIFSVSQITIVSCYFLFIRERRSGMKALRGAGDHAGDS